MSEREGHYGQTPEHLWSAAEISEQGGINALNERLRNLFANLRSAETPDLQREAMNGLNNLMYAAIYIFPHLVTSIQVRLKSDAVRNAEEVLESLGYDSGEKREKYDDLREAYSEQHGQTFSDIVKVPLPYSFTTGTHGSGERAASGASRETIAFEFTHHKRKRDTLIPVLGVEIEQRLTSTPLTAFMLDEIEDIQFATSDEFTPHVRSRRCQQTELIDRDNPAVHYLRFRNFSNRGMPGGRKNLSRLSDKEQEAIQQMMTPPANSNLWRQIPGMVRDKLRTGFIADPAGNTEGVKVYEFANTPLPMGDVYEAQAKLLARILRKGVKRSGVQVHSGMDAIARLMEIPVEERHF